ncbi:hypothetical protein [Parabacteroides distasonis]|uniref:hypothetical protein n=1 Tax=Parabacteroides distasonis TaxID=823 RepID=UPI0036F24214
MQCLSSFRHCCTEAGVASWQDSTIKWCGAKRPQAVRPCAAYRITLVSLCLYEWTPGEFGIVPSTIVCAAWASFRRADRWMRGLLDRPKRFVWFALLALVIGFVPHLYTMAVTIAFVLLAALFYPSARVMSEKTDIRKFLEWLECPGALADSYHSIITRGCHDNADNGNLKLSAHYESSKTE